MVLEAGSTIATYSGDTRNIKADGKVMLVGGDFTLMDNDNNITFQADNGMRVPILTEAEKNAISSPENGTIIYSSDINNFEFYQNGDWVSFWPKRIKVQIQTTSSSNVEVLRQTIPEGDALGYFVEAIGKRDNQEEVCYQNVQSAFYRNVGGSAERVGGQNGDGIRTTSVNGYRVSFDDDGNDAVIYVRGQNGHTVDWDIWITERFK